MPNDDRDLLEVLKFELEFLEKGGYGRSPRQAWRAPLIFEDSPTCLNFALPEKAHSCEECVLMQLVPEEDRNKSVPCNYIPLNQQGETVASLYTWAEQAETEAVVKDWLRAAIREMEEARANGQMQMSSPAEAKSLALAKCANPFCPAPYDPQGRGRYFILHQRKGLGETSQNRKHYWLCRHCSLVFSLVEKPGCGVVLKVRWPELRQEEPAKELTTA